MQLCSWHHRKERKRPELFRVPTVCYNARMRIAGKECQIWDFLRSLDMIASVSYTHLQWNYRDKACLCPDNFTVCILIFNSPQNPNHIRMGLQYPTGFCGELKIRIHTVKLLSLIHIFSTVISVKRKISGDLSSGGSTARNRLGNDHCPVGTGHAGRCDPSLSLIHIYT